MAEDKVNPGNKEHVESENQENENGGDNIAIGSSGGSGEQKSGGSQGGGGKVSTKIANAVAKGKQMVDNIKMAVKIIAKLLPYPFLVILAFICLIGIIMFFAMMPGILAEKLKQLFSAFCDMVAAWWGMDQTEKVDNAQMMGVLDYLEEMGYELKGEGFLTNYYNNEGKHFTDGESGYAVKDYSAKEAAEDNGESIISSTFKYDRGLFRFADTDKIALADSDFIFTYIVSDNYCYTLANKNLSTSPDAGFFDHLGLVVTKAWHFFTGPIADLFGAGDLMGEAWGRGLIWIYTEGSQIGTRGTFYQANITNFLDEIKIDSSAKTLIIKRVNWLNYNRPMEYSLDGWTGRYGMPLEFLVAVHKATGMPDLSYDLATSFATRVNMLLHKTDVGDVTIYIGNLTIEEFVNGISNNVNAFRKILYDILESASDFFNGIASVAESVWDFLSDFWAWLTGQDDSSSATTIHAHCTCSSLCVTEGENRSINTSCELCATLPGKCLGTDGYYDYTYNENIITTTAGEAGDVLAKLADKFIGATLTDEDMEYITGKPEDGGLGLEIPDGVTDPKKYVKELIRLGADNTDHTFYTYIPYVESVRYHWYRDVYFVTGTGATRKSNGGSDFVDLDYNYQAITDERWTLYNTDENTGEFLLYALDRDGNYAKTLPSGYNPSDFTQKGNYFVFNGNQEEANEKGYIVSKKAVTLSDNSTNPSLKDALVDLGWMQNDEGVPNKWTAYDMSLSSSHTENLFNEDQIESEEDPNTKAAMENLTAQVTIRGDIDQVGEGQRTETNSAIKKMFLENTYFKYDGSDSTAEAITRLRLRNVDRLKAAHKDIVTFKDVADTILGTGESGDSLNLHKAETEYGQVGTFNAKDPKQAYNLLDQSTLEFTYTGQDDREYQVTTDETKQSTDDLTVIHVQDLVGRVELNQESLDAFSILENMHTLDADYIYRDFKELIVELGYFTKEELTEGISRQLEFPIPSIGSSGFPLDFIDKNTNEIGTMIHSKGDIDAKTQDIYELLGQLYVEPERGDYDDGSTSSGQLPNTAFAQQDIDVEVKANNNIDSLVGAAPGGTQKCSRENGRNVNGDGIAGIVTVDGVEYTNYLQYAGPYHEKKFYWSGSYVTISSSACGPTSCVNILTGYGQDVNPTNTIVGLRFSATVEGIKQFMEDHDVTGFTCYDTNQYAKEMRAAFSEGRPFVALFNNNAVLGKPDFWTTGGHFVAFVGWGPDGIYTCDPAGSREERFIFPGTPEDLVPALKGIWFADEAPKGRRKDEAEYEGYMGNEAVVSPVTGVLVDYGVYDDEEDPVTGIIDRQNVDFVLKTGEDGSVEFSLGGEYAEKPYLSDKVGYAIIKVMDVNELLNVFKYVKSLDANGSKINSDLIQTAVTKADGTSYTKFKSVFDDSNGRPRSVDEMDDIDEAISTATPEGYYETILGYKEFVETYYTTGLEGYTVLVDGFVPEIPDEEYDIEKDYETKYPNQDKPENKIDYENWKDYFGQIKVSNGGQTVDGLENEKLPISMYEPKDDYKMASEKATEKAKLENSYMIATYPTLQFPDGTIIIKEGTVLGRTYTDKEFIEVLRNNEHGTYEELRPSAKEGYKIEFDEEGHATNLDTVLGNYIRVKMVNRDNEEVQDVENYMKLDDVTKKELEMEKFLFWMGCLAEGGHLKNEGGEWISVAVHDGVGESGDTHFFGITDYKLEEFKKASGKSSWASELPLEDLVNTYLILIEEDIEWIRQNMDENMDDGYLQGFISIGHNFGMTLDTGVTHPDFAIRAQEYLQTGQVTEETWTSDYTYSDDPTMDREMKKRRRSEYSIVTKGIYPEVYADNPDKEYDWSSYQNAEATGVTFNITEETPFSDWCEALGIDIHVDVSYLDK